MLAVGRGTTAAAENLTITGGVGSRGQGGQSGGGIFNTGNWTVTDATITGNNTPTARAS